MTYSNPVGGSGPAATPFADPVSGTKLLMKRSAVLNKVPVASGLEFGELLINYNGASAALYTKGSDGAMRQLGGVYIGNSAPANPVEGQWWWDADDEILYLRNAAAWLTVSEAFDITQASIGDLSDVDLTGISNDDLLAWNGTSFVPVSPGSIAVDVDLGYTAAPGNGSVTNTAGNDATIPARTDVNAGLMLPADKTAIDGLPADFDFLRSGDDVSELVNDAGYLTEAEVNNILQGNNPDGTPNAGAPTYLKPGDNVSELTNDAGYITLADVPDGVEKLDDLSDVSVPAPTSGQILKYNGASWVAGNPAAADISGSELNDLGDVNAPSPGVDQHLAWNGTSWVPVDPPDEFSGSYNDLTDKPVIPDALNDLSDVNADAPTADQVLQWNGAAWVPADVESGGALQDTVFTGLVWVHAMPLSNQVAGGPALTTNADKTWATRTSFVTHVSNSLGSILAGQTLTVKNLTQNQSAEYVVTNVDAGLNAVEVSYVSDTGGDIKAGNTFELVFSFAEGAGTGSVTSVGAGNGLRVADGGANPITSSGTLEVIAANATITVTAGGIAVTPDQYFPAAGGELDGVITTPEKTITSLAFDLSEGPFWTCGSIDVPNPTNAVAGMSGLIRFSGPPTSWGFNFKFVGGTSVAPSGLPAVSPFYVKAADEIYVGPAVEELI